MPKTRTFLALIAIPLTVLLLACGGGDSDDSSSSSGSSDGGTATQSSGSGSSNSNAQPDLGNCAELLGFARSLGVSGAFSGGDFGNFNAEVFQDLADNAPDEIKSDMRLLANALVGFFEVLDDLSIDFSNPASFASLSPADLQKLEDASNKIDSAEVQAASEKVGAFFENRCG